MPRSKSSWLTVPSSTSSTTATSPSGMVGEPRPAVAATSAMAATRASDRTMTIVRLVLAEAVRTAAGNLIDNSAGILRYASGPVGSREAAPAG